MEDDFFEQFPLAIKADLVIAGRRARAHSGRIAKRDTITVADTAYAMPTQDSEVIIYVDQFAKPVKTTVETIIVVPSPSSAISELQKSETSLTPSTTTEVSLSSTAAASTVARGLEASVSTWDYASTTVELSASSMQTQAMAPNPLTTYTTMFDAPTPLPLSPPPAPMIASDTKLSGVAYSPKKKGGTCKTAAEIADDFALFAKDYGTVRIYGVDCDQVASAYQAAKKYDKKLMLGIWDLENLEQSVQTIIKGIKGDWDIVDMISIGNERVNRGESQAGEVVRAVNSGRAILRKEGYNGPVTTVDTQNAVMDHPELCGASDVCTVNIHPFFSEHTSADQAGAFVIDAIAQIRGKLANSAQRIVVSECGWPWKGTAHGASVPSLDNQAKAIDNVIKAVSDPGDLILFEAFNSLWKQVEMKSSDAEPYWGIGGRYSPADKFDGKKG